MIRIYSLLAFLFISNLVRAQLIVTNPALPIDSQPVTITFDASQGNQGLISFTGDVYAYTGVITDQSTSDGNWKYVKASSWTDSPASCKMTRIDATHYSLSISPSIRAFYGVPAAEKIKKMAFVFHCPCPSGNGEPSGRDVGGKDILVNVYEAVLNVSFSQPADYFNLVQNNQTLNITANATNNDSICLFLDNAKVKSAIGQTLTYSVIAAGENKHKLLATAYKGTQSVSDTAYYLAHGVTQTQPVPTGVRDGITYPDNQSATFVLFAPYKQSVYLLGDFNNWTPDNNYLMKQDGNRFWITITGLTSGKEYAFQYLINDTIRMADPYSEKILDPNNDKDIPARIYPNLLPYPTGKTYEIAGVIQPGQSAFAWQKLNFTPPTKEKLVVYELLIRDFTANKDIKTITDTLSYLKRLGINAIELMPFNEFEGNDSWGYNPSFYFAPDKAYGTKDDYKKFIDACHVNGIAVIQDLVLNHSYGSSPLVRMYFANGVPTAQNPWYNQTSNMQNPALVYGYDFNHNSAYTQKLVDSVASFWTSEYKIDGFRYDFTKGFSNTPYGPSSWASEYDTMRVRLLTRMANAVWKRNSNAYVIFEHLADNSEETVLANAGILLWGNLNGAYSQASEGYTSGSDFSGISYKNRGWNAPNVMGYMESHDEERITFRNLNYGNSSGNYSVKSFGTALKRIELVSAFFYPVPGPKMLWEFGELGYDISIDQGGRLAAKPPHWEYYNIASRKQIYNVCKALIRLKKEEPVFSTNTFTIDAANTVKHIELLDPSANVEIVGNFDVVDQSYTLNFPTSGKWYEFFSGDSISLTGTTLPLTLKAGDYKLYASKKLAGFSSIATPVNQISHAAEEGIYPNPFSSELYLNNLKDFSLIEICNLQGKSVRTVSGAHLDSIDTSDLSAGLYFIKVHFIDKHMETYKAVKL